jgi:hypothetical protein
MRLKSPLNYHFKVKFIIKCLLGTRGPIGEPGEPGQAGKQGNDGPRGPRGPVVSATLIVGIHTGHNSQENVRLVRSKALLILIDKHGYVYPMDVAQKMLWKWGRDDIRKESGKHLRATNAFYNILLIFSILFFFWRGFF